MRAYDTYKSFIDSINSFLEYRGSLYNAIIFIIFNINNITTLNKQDQMNSYNIFGLK